MLFVSRAASAHGTRICGVAYWRAHDWNCLENFPNEALACNLLCKPVWTTPSALPPRSFSTHTHTHPVDLAGVECRWCHWVDVRQAIPSESAESWSREERRQRPSLSCTTWISFSCDIFTRRIMWHYLISLWYMLYKFWQITSAVKVVLQYSTIKIYCC